MCVAISVRFRSYVNLINVLNIRIFASHLQTLLFGTHPLEQCLYVVLHRIVDEFVLGLRLHHARPLRSDHLNSALDVDFRVQAIAFDLIKYHVDDDECARATDACRAMNAYWSLVNTTGEQN